MDDAQRGASLSAFVVVVVVALVLVAGLVVDGGQKAAATRRAEAVAAGAARAGADAAAASVIAGRPLDAARATRAARIYLDGSPGTRGSVTVARGTITVTTHISVSTIFLSIIGIEQLTGSGEVTQALRSSSDRAAGRR